MGNYYPDSGGINKGDRKRFSYTDLISNLPKSKKLAAENEGLGACWLVAYNPVVLKEALNRSEDQHIYAMTPAGSHILVLLSLNDFSRNQQQS